MLQYARTGGSEIHQASEDVSNSQNRPHPFENVPETERN
jgi:hypothetical protein